MHPETPLDTVQPTLPAPKGGRDVVASGDMGAIAQLASALDAAAGYRPALSALARFLVPRVADWCTIHVREATGELRLLAAAHADATKVAALREAARERAMRQDPAHPGRPDASANGSGLLGDVLATGKVAHLPVVARKDLGRLGGAQASESELAAAGTRAVLAVPMTMRPGAATADAVVTCATGDSGRPLDAGTVAFIVDAATIAAVHLRAIRRLDDEQQAHADAEAARQQVTAALEATSEAFVTVDRSWRITFLNAAATRLFGQPRAALLGQDLCALGRAAGGDLFGRCEELMHAGQSTEYEIHDPALDSWLEVRAFASGEGLSVHLRDVTADHRAEQTRAELLSRAMEARAEAVAANQAKGDFLASMSHELRTPLNAILGYVSLLADGITGPVTRPQVQQLDRIAASSRHLLALIEEILAFARLESGEERAYVEDGEAGALARDASHLVEPVIETQGLRFVVAVPDAPIALRTDMRKVRQVLLNLLANAARFTPAGGVVELRARADGADAVAFEVHDTGIGIATEHHERIFDAFWQVEQSRTRRVGGTGLGLSVSRRYARLLGGEITVDSTPGEGSTFTLRLPRRAPTDDADDGR